MQARIEPARMSEMFSPVRRNLLGLLGGSLAVLAASCSLLPDDLTTSPGWPQLGDPCLWVNVDTSRLQFVGGAEDPQHLDPFYSGHQPSAIFKDWPVERFAGQGSEPGIDLAHYRHMTVRGHFYGTGTYVYYLGAEDVFYLWGDDFTDHFDGMVGPFEGDPRAILPAVAEPVEPPPGAQLGTEACDTR